MRSTRRQFLHTTAALSALAAGGGVWSSRAIADSKSPSEKLNIGAIGTANKATSNIGPMKNENLAAICDIDDNYMNRLAQQYPKAQKYNDFRKLLEQKDLDAVIVSTADHTHAVASMGAIKLGKHVYCEKPLTHSVWESRMVAEAAKKYKVATQMGTQIHAGDNYRRVVELVQSGAIGPVHEVHVWCNKTWSGGERPKDTPPIPSHIHWDLWLGPAPERPYHNTYLPANWRRWWDFGGGTLNDMACHYMDLPFWALELRHPTTVQTEGPPVHPETTPPWCVVTYEFPARGKNPACTLTWTDGSRKAAAHEKYNLPKWGDGVLFVGAKGQLLANYGSYKLLPESDFAGFTPPPQTIPKSVGHHQEWINACKTGSPTTCNFDYGGSLSEAVILGNVAYRSGKKLEWDAEKLEAKNCPEAAQYVRREYRSGWTL